MANAGRVELDLVAVGKDEVSAMLRKVEAQARQMATGMKEAGASTGNLGEQLAGLKERASGVDKVRNAFESLRSNVFFVTSTFAALGGVIIEVVDSLFTGTEAMQKWEATQEGMADGLKKTRDLLADIDEFLGKGPTKWDTMYGRVNERLNEIREGIATGEVAIAQTKARMEALAAAVPGMGMLVGTVNDAIKRDQEAINKLKREQYSIESKSLELQEEQSKVTAGQVAMLAWLRGGSKAPSGSSVNPFLGFGGGESDPSLSVKGLIDAIKAAQASLGGGRGAGSNEPAAQLGDFFGQTRPVSGRFASADTSGSPYKTPVDEIEAITESLKKATPQAELFARAFENVASALSSVSAELPEVTDAFGELTTITTNYSEQRAAIEEDLQGRLAEIREMNLTAAEQAAKEKQAQDDATAKSQSTLTQALAAGGTAIAANAAKAIGGVRAEAAVRAAYEVGMGFATLATPAISAGHFTAAALLGAVAAGAGGGGGGGRAGGSSRGERADSGGSGGPSTIVYNFSSLVTDQQQVTTALRRAGRSSRGTGHESRAGV